MRIHTFFIALCLLAVAAQAPFAADVADREWIFVNAGNDLGWKANTCPYWTSYGVAAGYWWGENGPGEDVWVMGPDNLNLPASPNHYISVKLRLRLASGEGNRFGATPAQIYWATNVDPNFSESKRGSFTAYGNGAWKVYNIKVGHHPQWEGTIKRIRVDPMTKAYGRVEIAYIKIMRDLTPPSFEAENMWTYADGEETNNNTPTIHLRNASDFVFGIDRAEFYRRPGSSTSEGDWQLDGVDSDGTDGWQYKYSQLPDGVYDLGVKVYDKAGNVGYWAHGDDRWIDDLRIDSGLNTRIEVNASSVRGNVSKAIFGNNVVWNQWSNKYNSGTGRLPDSLENLIERMGTPILRYPGGCYSDTFYWKKSIGPVASRPVQYVNGCNRTLYNAGPAIFGLDEFLRFCEDRGFEPMITCRFRWPGGPRAGTDTVGFIDSEDPYGEALQDAIDLVEYCNSPNDGSNPNGGTDWAAVRAANGHPEPYNVKLFEIGNEPWGPDPWGSPGMWGFDGPSEYSVAFLSYLEGMLAVDPTISVSATAHIPSQLDFDPANPDWAASVYEQAGPFVGAAQIHPYLPYSAWQTDPVKLYDETMATPKALDDVIANQKRLIAITNPDKVGEIALRLTEWNINYSWWYDPSQGRINIYHTRTLKAAIALADAFRVFIENGDIVESSEWWHLYAGTWSCIETDDTTTNPAYHSFRIFNKHFGDELVASRVIGSPTFDYVQSGGVLKSQYGLNYLTAIASRSEDGKSLYLVVINKDRLYDHSAQVNVSQFLQAPYDRMHAEIWELNGLNVDDYSRPQDTTITESEALYASSFEYLFPAHSVTSFKFTTAPVAAERISDAKRLPDGTRVSLQDKVVTAVLAPDILYVEEEDRSSGLRIHAGGTTAVEANRVSLTGTVSTTAAGERFIEAATITHDSSLVVLEPLGLLQRSFVVGLDSTGLLVTIWGLTSDSYEDGFYVTDGSGRTLVRGPSPGDDRFVRVTGIRSLDIPEGGSKPEPVVLTRRGSDIVPLE